MGCAASKLDNEDALLRCKERRHLAKEAVHARHHLAAAHSDYCRFLRLTGATLSAFAAGEPLKVSNRTPPVVLRSPSSLSRSSTLRPPTISSPSSPGQFPFAASRSFHAPQPPSPFISSSKPPHVLTNSGVELRRSKPQKLPHILSDSSPCASPTNTEIIRNSKFNYPTTPSQASSSVWNWDFRRPPSPPDSEYFDRRERNLVPGPDHHNNSHHQNDDYGFFQTNGNYAEASDSKSLKRRDGDTEPENRTRIHHDHHLDADDEAEREEVQCSDWGDGDHYSSASSTEENADEEDDEDDRREEPRKYSATGSSFRKRSSPAKSNFDDLQSSVSWNAGRDAGSEMMKVVVRHKDLKEIIDAIKDYFDRVASEGEKMSETLETGGAELDLGFSQLKRKLYHSSGILSNLTSNWSSKPPLSVKYRLDPPENGDSKSLRSTLDKLWTWEKKLYDEVKARETAKIELEKKLSTLQSQEYKGEDESKLNKTKASIKKLQSEILVTSQAVNTTSAAINGLKDTDLVPLLVGLSHGLLYMWRSMNELHEVQNCIVQQVHGLVNQVMKGESTTDVHRQVTRDLEASVSAWHSSFCRLIKFQREFIRSLHGWLKLSLIPVDGETLVFVSHIEEPSEVLSFLDEWKLALDRIPDTVASEAIKSFAAVIHVITVKQTEELKMKKRADNAAKELEKKASSLRSIERKFYGSFSTVGLGIPESGPSGGVIDVHDPLAEKKVELAAYQSKVEDEMTRHSKAMEVTRSMTVNNIQSGLPTVFQAITSFSGAFMDAMQVVCTRSYSIGK